MIASLLAAVVTNLWLPLDAKGSHCIVSYLRSNGDYDPSIMVSCGATQVVLEADNHGVSASRLSACYALVTAEWVKRPTLYSVDNCAGRLKTANLSERWEGDLARRAKTITSRILSADYYPLKGKPGCYRLEIAYEHFPNPNSTPLDSIAGDYCAPPLP